MLTFDRLREVLHYDPDTGVFTRLTQPGNSVMVGSIAGTLNSRGYLHIMIDRRRYQAHRLAWLYMTGEWPEKDIDHIDLDKTNNRFANLRNATNSQNQANVGLRSDNTSGFKGVSYHKQARKWQAQIRSAGKVKSLGLFESAEGAHEAYCLAAEKFHGEYARNS